MGSRLGVLFAVVLVVLFEFSIGEAADIRPDTILYYGFDGTEGNDLPGSLLDATGAYTATIIAGTDPDSAIRYAAANPTYNPSGTSAEFYNDNWSNNAGDTLLIPDSGGLDFNSFDEFTVELFIWPDSSGSGQYRRIFSEYIYAYMYLDPSNTLHAVRKWGGGAWNENWTLLSMPGFPLDEWFHVAMTWDADAVGDKFKLYVDGELTGSAAGTSTPTIDSSAGFTIGGYQREDTSTAQFFRGKIDEFRLSDAALEPVDFVGAPASISFSTASSGGVENLSPAHVAVTLKNAEQGQTYSVDYSVIGGTAVPGVDYALVTPCDCDLNQSGRVDFGDIGVLAGDWLSQTPGSPADVTDDNSVDFADFSVCALEWFLCDIDTLQFGPGQTARMICVDVFDDHISEGEETIELMLSGATGPNAELGSITQHTYTIFEVVPQVSFAAETGSVGESDSTVMVAVTLSHAGSETITVDYSVTGGTATGEGVDYSLADGTLLFAPGQTITYISIEIVDDTLVEDDETVELTLSDPTNATMGSIIQHTNIITDNEPGVLFDGMVWYCSGSGGCLTATEAELVWDGGKEGQIVVRLPEQRFSQVGDVVTFSYVWTSSGEVDYGCECYHDYNPDPDIYEYCTDIRCIGGTGDFRIGLFDSSGEGYITDDNLGANNEIFRGYRGYHFRVFPHVPQDAPARFTEYKTGGGSESHTNTSIWERNEPLVNSALLSNSNSWNRIDQPMAGGFGLDVGQSSLLIIRLERISSTQAEMTIACNGKDWTKYSETASVIPDKIDVFAMYSNSNEYDYVKLSVTAP